MDCFDIVEGLTIQGGTAVDVLNGISLHGGLVGSWPRTSISASVVLQVLQVHWEEVGCPTYVQFDNDTRFQGPHNNPDALGRVPRFCLQLGVTPVFAPPRETGFQAAIEAYNGRWQLKVWRRFHHDTLDMLLDRSNRYVHAYRQRLTDRIEASPPRRKFPDSWSADFQRELAGRVIFIRRTTEAGMVRVLERNYEVDPHWIHRLVRAEVDLTAGVIRFYSLRRREPLLHRLLNETPYQFPRRRFRG